MLLYFDFHQDDFDGIQNIRAFIILTYYHPEFVTVRDTGVYPKFTGSKNVKINKKNIKVISIVALNIVDEIHNKHQFIKQLRKDLTTSMENLSSATSLFKSIIRRISINRLVLKDEKKIIKRHRKKLPSLLDKKNKENNIQANPDLVVINLSSHVLTNEEYIILQFVWTCYSSKPK